VSKAVERILGEIADLSAKDRGALLDRLARAEDRANTSGRRAAARFSVGDLEGPADYVIVFDGGSHGNPGPGYGSYAVARRGQKKPRLTRLDFGPDMTNNEAEYEALIAALEGLASEIRASGVSPGESTVEIRGDSTLVIRQVEGSWKAKAPRMLALRDRARQLLGGFGGHRLVIQPRSESVRVLGH
jgi:ribonuclease HI